MNLKMNKFIIKVICGTILLGGLIPTVEAASEVLGWSENWKVSGEIRDYNKNSYTPSSSVVHKGWIYYPDYNTEYYVGHTWWTNYHYTRARGEQKVIFTTICGDSGRKFDTDRDGYSTAKSGVCVQEYVGKTYYGVE